MLKKLSIGIIALCMAAGLAQAQAQDHWLGTGVTWDQESAPSFIGVGQFDKVIHRTSEGKVDFYSSTSWDMIPYKGADGKWKAQFVQRTGVSYVPFRAANDKIEFLINVQGGGSEANSEAGLTGGIAYAGGGGVRYTCGNGFTLSAQWQDVKTTKDNNPKVVRLFVGWRF